MNHYASPTCSATVRTGGCPRAAPPRGVKSTTLAAGSVCVPAATPALLRGRMPPPWLPSPIMGMCW